GTYDLTVVAKDNNGKSTSQVITLTVGDQYTRSVYLNLGSAGKAAPAPWNNWLGTHADSSSSGPLKDENNATTTLSVTTINGWSGNTNLGHITGNNSGAF